MGVGDHVLVYGATGAIGSAAVQLLKPGGVFLTTDLGPRAENLLLIVASQWIGDHRVRLPFPTDTRAHVRLVGELLASRDLRPVVDRTFPLDDIVDAYRYVETEQKLGTVVITVT